MRTAIKVFIRISQVVGVISFIIGVISGFINIATAGQYGEYAGTIVASGMATIIGSAFSLLPLILGNKALDKFESALRKSETTAWAVITLIFVSLIAGILMLAIDEKEFALGRTSNTHHSYTSTTHTTSSSTVQSAPKAEAKPAIDPTLELKRLKDLHEAGILTDEEYHEKRQKYIDQL